MIVVVIEGFSDWLLPELHAEAENTAIEKIEAVNAEIEKIEAEKIEAEKVAIEKIEAAVGGCRL